MDHTLDPETARLIELAADPAFHIERGPPLTKFRHISGSVVLTRDAATYRQTAGWTELIADVSSPVPAKRWPR